jgi:hypothetical protein
MAKTSKKLIAAQQERYHRHQLEECLERFMGTDGAAAVKQFEEWFGSTPELGTYKGQVFHD